MLSSLFLFFACLSLWQKIGRTGELLPGWSVGCSKKRQKVQTDIRALCWTTAHRRRPTIESESFRGNSRGKARFVSILVCGKKSSSHFSMALVGVDGSAPGNFLVILFFFSISHKYEKDFYDYDIDVVFDKFCCPGAILRGT